MLREAKNGMVFIAGTALTDTHYTTTLDTGPVQCNVGLCRSSTSRE